MSDITLENGHMRISLRTSKTDQFGSGCSLLVPGTERPACLLAAMKIFEAVPRAQPAQRLFFGFRTRKHRWSEGSVDVFAALQLAFRTLTYTRNIAFELVALLRQQKIKYRWMILKHQDDGDRTRFAANFVPRSNYHSNITLKITASRSLAFCWASVNRLCSSLSEEMRYDTAGLTVHPYAQNNYGSLCVSMDPRSVLSN